MAINYTPIPLFPVGQYPLTNIQPFTYSDGVTYTQLLYWLIDYVNKAVAQVDENEKELFDDVVEKLNETITTVNNALGEQTAEVNEAITNLTEYVDNAVQSIINNSIEVQDPVAAALINDVNSLTHTALDQTNSSLIGSDSETRKALVSSYGDSLTFTGETNRSSEIQEWVNDLANGFDKGSLRPGIYVCENIVIPPYVILDGNAGGSARFGLGVPNRFGAVQFRRPSDSMNNVPMIHLDGAGSAIKNITLDGNGASGNLAPVLVQEGFESCVNHVRIINAKGIGYDVWKANNAEISYVYIDNVGSVTLPGMRVRSVLGAGSAGATNAQMFNNITIERCFNTALEIGEKANGSLPIEWCSFNQLHIESPNDGVPEPGNASPLIKIGGVKGLTFINPFIYGGPGALIEHDSETTYSVANSGIRVIGGHLLGQEEWGTSSRLIDLVNGDNFGFSGTQFNRYTSEAIRVRASYGGGVFSDGTNVFSGTPINDLRVNRSPNRVVGDIATTGRFIGGSQLPSISGAPHVVSPTIQPGSDSGGRVYFGTNNTPASGDQLEVTFTRPYSRIPSVIITPLNAGSAEQKYYVGITNEKFYIRFQNTPPANVGGSGLGFAYQVIG